MSPKATRVFLVTGGTGAIGQAIVRQLAGDLSHEVVFTARDRAKAERTLAAVHEATRNPAVRYVLADLSLHADIHAVRAAWRGPLHVLINNAGECPRRREETEEGVERQFATNVLGYYRMMRAFGELLAEAAHPPEAPARVVNVASYWAGGLDLDDLEFQRRPYDNDAAYRQSKQADRMLACAFAERWKSRGVTVNAVHPGEVRSRLARDLGFGGHETADEGADTPVWVATEREGAERTGTWFKHRRALPDPFCDGKDKAIRRLIEICTRYDKHNR